jgi:lysozyme
MAQMNRDALANQLIADEGMVLKPYKDTVGKTTIGVGRNLDDVGITKSEAMMLLGADIDKVEAQLDAQLPWWRGMSDARQRVLANMAFNLGIIGLLGFKNTLASMKAGDYKAAAAGMLASKWAGQVGDRAKRLAEMMEKG